ncbi:Bifunctional dethiobiotin synthetase/7-8-diamino-pelargonic acid aminotransferase [Venturia nashicola]|uniref:Bifunctional dethiobiotin synthetase/7/8-diamino-pelargonic acid aminotransferase n=1 Tax=Venturia nashicola TaxID=86259 RepID=A0A4Z1PWE1_9PEZI|nr:Bifunctional dethiobiotin synthetase/7/8-diamino-pelargonic acid aminotransferase [Venturia nashicola]TLD39507.1 Bifunctional dethiobiotin synthetase/7-8-diamino-pelargonic acid aminotransferase [Venturia nashicola]
MESSRKRPLTYSSSPGDDGYADDDAGQAKRVKDSDEIADIGLIPPEEAWNFVTEELLDSPTTIPTPDATQFDGNNFKNYDSNKSLFVLCVLEDLTLSLAVLHYALPSLLHISPNLQALVIARSPTALSSIMASSPVSLPIVEAQGNPANHFLKLGLLHPLGGGQRPLDAIVILDTAGRRRLVIPFGWGAGKHVGDLVSGPAIQQRFLTLLQDSVVELEREKAKSKKKDFYEVAKMYF